MRFQSFAFGSVKIDGKTYDHDVVLDGGVVRKRDKKASRPLRSAYGHTPLSLSENIPWDCRRLVIGTGAQGALPLVPELRREAERRGVELWRCRPSTRSRCWRRARRAPMPSSM